MNGRGLRGIDAHGSHKSTVDSLGDAHFYYIISI